VEEITTSHRTIEPEDGEKRKRNCLPIPRPEEKIQTSSSLTSMTGEINSGKEIEWANLGQGGSRERGVFGSLRAIHNNNGGG